MSVYLSVGVSSQVFSDNFFYLDPGKNSGKVSDINLTFICSDSELSDPASFGFSVERNGEVIEGFLVKNDGQYFAYKNSCPHTGSPLDWLEHQFLDSEGALIQCAVHDARFLIETGECIVGPCHGESLQRLEIKVKDDGVYLLG